MRLLVRTGIFLQPQNMELYYTSPFPQISPKVNGKISGICERPGRLSLEKEDGGRRKMDESME